MLLVGSKQGYNKQRPSRGSRDRKPVLHVAQHCFSVTIGRQMLTIGTSLVPLGAGIGAPLGGPLHADSGLDAAHC